MVGTKNPLIPTPFLILEAAHLCTTKETLLKGRFIGFSEVAQHGNILTKHWKKNRKQWIENQYPKNWSDRVVFETLNKINEGKKNLEVKASETRNDKWLKYSPSLLAMQYRGNPSQLLAAKFG